MSVSPDIWIYSMNIGDGTFTYDGRICTFLSYDDCDFDVLYIGLDAEGTIGVEP